jgi:FkbM family methyltransferase
MSPGLKAAVKSLMCYVAFGWTPAVRKVSKALVRALSPKSDVMISVHGHRMYARRFDRIVALLLRKLSLVESSELSAIQRLIPRGGTVVEVGANTGYFTLKFAKWAGSGGRVVAYEPDAENFRLLTKNIAANGYRNVSAEMKAASDRAGSVDLYVCEDHGGDHRIYDPCDGRGKVTVEAVALDDTGVKPDFVKIDVQGVDYLVLKGMERAIRENRKLTVMMQFSPYLIEKAGSNAAAVLSSIRGLGLNVYVVSDKPRLFEPLTDGQLMERCGGLSYVNLILSRLSEVELDGVASP